MMNITKLSYSDLRVKAMMLLDTDDKVRTFLMESTRIMKALTFCDALSDEEQRTMKLNYWRFVLCCNLTPTINRKTAIKIYARFSGGYCEGLGINATCIIGMIFDDIAESISRGESKEEQQEILNLGVAYLYK